MKPNEFKLHTFLQIKPDMITKLVLFLSFVAFPLISLAETYDGGNAEVLRVMWRVLNAKDYASTISSSERDSMPGDGAIFYIPEYAYEQQPPLYRLQGPSDHMDSRTATQYNYNTEMILGYPYLSQDSSPGLTPLMQGYNPLSGDHLTANQYEIKPNYTMSSMNIFGFARYNNQAEVIINDQGGGVALEANKVAGCSIWRWTWNGKQFLNNGIDYGRQMQGSIFWQDSGGNTPNPTEAGDINSLYLLAPQAKHGSPCVSASVNGTTLSTATVPLEWNGNSLAGTQGGPDSPVIWRDLLIAKDVTLNYQNMGPVADYHTHITLARPLSKVNVEIPTAYLSPEFRQFITFDAATNSLINVAITSGESLNYAPPSGYGGVIAATLDGNYAMGIFGISTSLGGSVSGYNIGNFIVLNNGDISEGSEDTVKLNAVYSGSLPAGTTHFRSWVLSGTVAGVRSAMLQIYNQFSLLPQVNNPIAAVFSPANYLNFNPDLMLAFGSENFIAATQHWNTYGSTTEGRRGSYALDVKYYLANNPDLVGAFGMQNYSLAIKHFSNYGIHEGRRASFEFDAVYYLSRNPDLAAVFKNSDGTPDYQAATLHYLTYGLNEGRGSSANFDVGAYLARYPDLIEAFGATGYAQAFHHWVVYGKNEGRNPAPN